jgi:predicted transposase YdaD
MKLLPAYLKQRQEWLVRGKLETVPNLQKLGLNVEEIAEILELEVEQVRAYLNS